MDGGKVIIIGPISANHCGLLTHHQSTKATFLEQVVEVQRHGPSDQIQIVIVVRTAGIGITEPAVRAEFRGEHHVGLEADAVAVDGIPIKGICHVCGTDAPGQGQIRLHAGLVGMGIEQASAEFFASAVVVGTDGGAVTPVKQACPFCGVGSFTGKITSMEREVIAGAPTNTNTRVSRLAQNRVAISKGRQCTGTVTVEGTAVDRVNVVNVNTGGTNDGFQLLTNGEGISQKTQLELVTITVSIAEGPQTSGIGQRALDRVGLQTGGQQVIASEAGVQQQAGPLTKGNLFLIATLTVVIVGEGTPMDAEDHRTFQLSGGGKLVGFQLGGSGFQGINPTP